MVKVKLTIARCGPDGSYQRGDTIEVSAEEAERLIGAGKAVPLAKAKVERTVKRKPASEETR